MHRALAATLILITAAGILIHHKDIPIALPIAHQPPAITKSSSSFHSTTLTDYLAITRTALTAQVKLIGATVDREYVHVEHIQQSTFGVPTDATVIIRYAVAFAFGYDFSHRVSPSLPTAKASPSPSANPPSWHPLPFPCGLTRSPTADSSSTSRLPSPVC